MTNEAIEFANQVTIDGYGFGLSDDMKNKMKSIEYIDSETSIAFARQSNKTLFRNAVIAGLYYDLANNQIKGIDGL